MKEPIRDAQDKSEKKRYEIHGKVTGARGEEVSGAAITVWWKRIRKRIQLGKGRTSEEGEYRIRIEVPEDTIGPILIVVEARSKKLPAPLESPVTALQPDLEVDLAAQPPDSSEFGKLLDAITAQLDDVPLLDVVESADHQDISFLAQETGNAPEQIMRVVASARLESAFGIPAAVFFAFLRQHVPSSLPSALLDASQNFTLIDALVARLASLIFNLAPDTQTRTLQEAVAQNLIGKQFEDQIADLVKQLQAHRTTDLLQNPYLVGNAALGQLLDLADIADNKQQAFAQALAQNEQSMRTFWRTLGDGQHGFTSAEASAIERTLSIGAFVKNHLPLIQVLFQRFTSGTYKTLSDLARLTQQDWIQLVKQVGPPPNIGAAGAANPAEVFARVIYARVTRAFPTVALANRIAAGNFVPRPVREPLHQFFLHNASLDLIRHNVAAYLEQQGDKAFTGIAAKDRAAVVANVKRLQRVLFVTPEVDIAQTLLEVGIHSATQIASMGRQQFFKTATTAGISKRDANRIYDTGVQRYAGLVSFYTQFNRDAIGIWPNAVGKTSDLNQPMSDAIQRDQSLSTLFGSQDYCAVDSCTSILSPAAYLCDLLYWLKQRMTGAQSALDVLNGRRPDIANLKLNCPNSQTPMPYIDLVNEILADAISPPNDPNSTINPPWKQTSANKTAADLRASPEYFNADAYNVLFGTNYPHTLPYSEGLDELRSYLQQSKIALWQLRQALLLLHNPITAQRVAVAAERFAMPPHDVDLVANANFINANLAWNIPAAQNPSNALVPVPSFLQAALLSYEQLLELLQVAWVKGNINLTLEGVDDTCDTSIQSLSPAPLDAGLLDRAHRFLRLWRRTGYKMWELDLLMTAPAVANGTLDANALISLFTFRTLQDATRLAVDQQLAFFQTMDIASHRDPDGSATTSLYGRVFLNPAVTSQHPDADLVALATGAATNDSDLSHHLDAIQAALGISAPDANALITLFGLAGPNTLTLANLSLLYRVTQLATASGLSLSDQQNVARLTNPGAASVAAAVTQLFASSLAMLGFLQQVASIQQSGFSIDSLLYLLVPPPWTTATGITDAGITTVLTAVRQAILNPVGGDVNGSVIAAVAAQLGLANDVTAFVVQQLNVPGTAQTLLAVLTDPALTNPPGGPYPAIDRANYPNQFVAVQLIDKVGVIVKRVHLVKADLSWLITNSGVYGGLDFTQLPVTNAQATLNVALLLTTVLLVKLARMFNAAPPQSPIQSLYDLIGGVNAGTIPNEALAQAELATITGWNLADITSFATALGAVFPADYTTPALYDALRKLEAMITAMSGKAQGSQLVNWSQVPANEAAAESIATDAVSVLKARYSNTDWLTVAPPIINPIREDRSAALQAYLVAQRDNAGNLIYGDVDGLFDHFLIDAQMSSCEVTTRIVQAYIAVQIFVERCRMNLEAPAVVVDPGNDDAWDWWRWMKRYRIWEAAREVFLYPENWLVESQRPNRTEMFHKLEQEVHQNQHTSDALETVLLNYIERLDEVAHLRVTGTCQDPITGAVHVVARTLAEPPRFYHRALNQGAWSGWVQIPLDIKSHQVVPSMYRGRLCLFWPEIKVSNEPHQNLPPVQQSPNPPSQEVAKYTAITLHFTTFRNNAWAPTQATRGKLFDKPPLDSMSVSNSSAVEGLYTLKVQSQAPTPGYGTTLFIDVFRPGVYQFGTVTEYPAPDVTVTDTDALTGVDDSLTVQIGRAVFDGRFSDLELRNLSVPGQEFTFFGATFIPPTSLLTHAQSTYGPDAQPLLPLPDSQADPNLTSEPGLTPEAGTLATQPANPNLGNNQTLPLTFTGVALEQNAGPLLNTASVPFWLVGPDADLNFDPTGYFFYQDTRRCYNVESQKLYWSGSSWTPNPPSYPNTVPFEEEYVFHRFYHPYTRLFHHQLAGGGLAALYDQNLQLNPDQVDPSHADVFSFQNTYNPVTSRVSWGEDNEIIDFSQGASYSVYNWELFFHNPLYIAQLLSQNQQFEDAQSWFHYIFDPTRQSADPAPKRFWIPKPLYDLTSADILSQRINNLLQLVNQGDQNAINQVLRWRKDPFNPFLLADLRPVAYMKAVVMGYLDNLIAWADNLFATDSREALSEATLLYVIAAEILGPQPAAIMPPQHTDDSYNDLAPKLDAFANAMVDIENVIGQGGGGGGGGDNGGVPPPQTFYFKIPPNDKLLGYWKTVADRLFKLRHCQNIQGITRQLALFDAPIDPGLLIKAQAAGVDIGSVLADLTVALPNYRFTALYPQALDFVNAVRAYGALLLSALEKSDADQLAVMTATNQKQLLSDADQIFDWQVQQAQSAQNALQNTRDIADEKYNHYNDLTKAENFANAAEWTSVALTSTGIVLNAIVTGGHSMAAVAHAIPDITVGVQGFGGTAVAIVKEGGSHAGNAGGEGSKALNVLAGIADKSSGLAKSLGDWWHRHDDNAQKAAEAKSDRDRADIQLAGAGLALQIAQQNQTNHQTQIDQLQQQLDFLTDKFTNQDLYDWMVGQLSETYFQSYRLAYKLCKQVERCYRYELGITDSNFIQFGYWDSLHKGLLAGETLNQDLRRMQASYLEKNSRRFEMSRFISLNALDPNAFAQLVGTGACDFDIPESLFDHDYPGHYNRHLVRASVTVVYPNPGKFDNVKATLTLVKNKVRVFNDPTPNYAENPVGADPRFVYNYAAVPQQIVLGNAQDDPGLFLTAINNNLNDQRYLPFEGGGGISSWHFEMPAASNEIALNRVTDVVIHLYYTALYGGDNLKQAVLNG
jgi:hypothetical protein